MTVKRFFKCSSWSRTAFAIGCFKLNQTNGSLLMHLDKSGLYSQLDSRKTFSSKGINNNVMNVFDRTAKKVQRERAALYPDEESVTVFDYLKEETGYTMADRIYDIKREFDVAVELGCGRGHVFKHVYSDIVSKVYQCELSPTVLNQAETSSEIPTFKLVVDEEFIPFKDDSVNLFISNLSLHWVNDLPSCFKQVLRSLKNDGVFMGSLFSGDTLFELRVALQLAELEREGGVSPHISPFTTASDLSGLLSQAGFSMVTLDVDVKRIHYPSVFELMYDLKGMAENNCSWSRRISLHRDTMIAAAAIYKDKFGNDTGVPATFEIMNFIAWKPDPSQPKPAKRGSGSISMKDLGKLNQYTQQINKIRQDQGEGEITPAEMEEIVKKIQEDAKREHEKQTRGGEDDDRGNK